MCFFKYISLFLFLLAISSCTSEKKTFQKKIMYYVEIGYPCFFVVPAYINNQKTELCLTDDDLKAFLYKAGKELPRKVYLSRLKKAIDNKYAYRIEDTSNIVKYYAINDSVYNYVSSFGFKEMTSKYLIVNYKAEMIRTDISSDEMNAVIKAFYSRNYIVETGGYTGYSYPVAPPHKLPTRAMRRAADEPFSNRSK